MKQGLIIILLLTIGCSKTKDNHYAEKILGEQFDSKGRLKKRVVTGRIPGEDIYLTITKYDSTGRVTEEYGARPYGTKYRTEFRYDTNDQVIERLNYTFFSGDFDSFENHKSEGLYDLTDTLVNFDGIADHKTLLTYNHRDSVVIEHHYNAVYDSLAGKDVFELSGVDTFDIKEN